MAERMNQTLLDMVTSTFRATDIPKLFLGDALVTAAHILNRVTSKSLSKDTAPHELWHESKQNLEDLLVLRPKCLYKLSISKIRKFNDRAAPGVFLGYFSQHLGYYRFDITTQKAIIS